MSESGKSSCRNCGGDIVPLSSHGRGKLTRVPRYMSNGFCCQACSIQSRTLSKYTVRTQKELAEALNVSVDEIKVWVKEGMPRRRLSSTGSGYHYNIDDVYAWDQRRKAIAAGYAPVARVELVPEEPEKVLEQVHEFKMNRADIFAQFQLQVWNQMGRLRQFHLDEKSDDDIRGMTTNEFRSVYSVLSKTAKDLHDMERVERTKGVDDITKILEVIRLAQQIQRSEGDEARGS